MYIYIYTHTILNNSSLSEMLKPPSSEEVHDHSAGTALATNFEPPKLPYWKPGKTHSD